MIKNREYKDDGRIPAMSDENFQDRRIKLL
jgi:hypothetical protein